MILLRPASWTEQNHSFLNRLDEIHAILFRQISSNSVVVPTIEVDLPGRANTEGFPSDRLKFLIINLTTHLTVLFRNTTPFDLGGHWSARDATNRVDPVLERRP